MNIVFIYIAVPRSQQCLTYKKWSRSVCRFGLCLNFESFTMNSDFLQTSWTTSISHDYCLPLKQ